MANRNLEDLTDGLPSPSQIRGDGPVKRYQHPHDELPSPSEIRGDFDEED